MDFQLFAPAKISRFTQLIDKPLFPRALVRHKLFHVYLMLPLAINPVHVVLFDLWRKAHAQQ